MFIENYIEITPIIWYIVIEFKTINFIIKSVGFIWNNCAFKGET